MHFSVEDTFLVHLFGRYFHIGLTETPHTLAKLQHPSNTKCPYMYACLCIIKKSVSIMFLDLLGAYKRTIVDAHEE